MRRFVSVWLLHYATDLWRRMHGDEGPTPFALTAVQANGLRLTAVDAAATALGLEPGQSLPDARALVPELQVEPAEPAAEQAAIERLAAWCSRWSPSTATDGPDGLSLDITGCAHLFGGEAGLLVDLRRRLEALGFGLRLAAADTPGTAWAWARFGTSDAIPAGCTRAALASLPVAALQLEEAEVAVLRRLGLGRVGELYDLPRGPLRKRFAMLLARLDAALGVTEETLSPQRPLPRFSARLSFAEPIGTREDLERLLQLLLADLVVQLERASQGVRRLEFSLYRVDGSLQGIAIGTSRPNRVKAHLYRLLRERLDEVDPGFGIDLGVLSATATDPLGALQLELPTTLAPPSKARLDELIDRLQNKLGRRRVLRLAPLDSHLPERAFRQLPAEVASASAAETARRSWPARGRRPLALLLRPEPIEAIAQIPDHPPAQFLWRRVRHRIVAADGPERIEPEWWRDDWAAMGRLLLTLPHEEQEGEDAEKEAAEKATLAGEAGLPDLPAPTLRDYYRVEDAEGRRFWVFRIGLYPPGEQPRWYLHGFFA